MSELQAVYLVVRSWANSEFEPETATLVAYLTREQAEEHVLLAQQEIKSTSEKSQHWGDPDWTNYRSPYDPTLRVDELGLSRGWQGRDLPVSYSVLEVRVVAHVDEFME